jgi:hypothetical protein
MLSRPPVLVGNSISSEPDANRVMLFADDSAAQIALWSAHWAFRSSARREAEILVLRHQINVLRRKSSNRPALNNIDRLLFVLVSRLVPTTLDALTVIRPDTVIRWHRSGFRTYWCWKSRRRGGRPTTPPEAQQLIRDMSKSASARRTSRRFRSNR